MDRFEQRLATAVQKLKECQQGKGYTGQYNDTEYSTCTPCPQQMECKIRLDYIATVYKSMSREKAGGFEF